MSPLDPDTRSSSRSENADAFPRPGNGSPIQKVEHLLRAKYGLVFIPSPEEHRILDALTDLVSGTSKTLQRWTTTDGLVPHPKGGTDEKTGDPIEALGKVLDTPAEAGKLFVFCDLHRFWQTDDPMILRLLRDCAHRLRGTSNTLVLLSPQLDVPEDLEKDVAVVDFPLPTREELAELVTWNLGELAGSPQVQEGRFAFEHSDELREEIVQACAGLTELEAEDALARAVIECSGLTDEVVGSIQRTKRETIRKSGALEAIEVSTGMDDVGGLDNLKDWVRRRRRIFSEDARKFGIEPPKGLLTMGIPGTGKGLSARAVASTWRLPLLRLDMGALFNKWVGQSEANLREALKVAEAIAPVVLWLDEVEKALGGMGGDAGDNGTSSRVFGHFLTWLEERGGGAPVVTYFTANDVSRLPPELLRKGRVDEIFFLDLPNAEERREILEIHLEKRDRDPANFHLDTLVEETRGLVGAEIEQGIKEGLVDAFSDDRDLQTGDLVRAYQRTVPLVKSQRAKLQTLFRYVEEGRAVRASRGERVDPEEIIRDGPSALGRAVESDLPW